MKEEKRNNYPAGNKPAGYIYLFYKSRSYFNSDVQCGQRVALMEMMLKQCGHSFMTGSATGSGFFILFAAFTIRKITMAIRRKSMMVCTNAPHLITAAPTINACSLKFTPPMTSPITGVIMSPTSEVTILPNAPPMITAIARFMLGSEACQRCEEF